VQLHQAGELVQQMVRAGWTEADAAAITAAVLRDGLGQAGAAAALEERFGAAPLRPGAAGGLRGKGK
jgi:hypothetical protein